MRKNRIFAALAVGALAVGTSIVGFRRDDAEFKMSKNLDIFVSVLKEVKMYYVEEPDMDKMVPIAIEEMLASLDPYTTYIPEQDKEAYKFQIDGKYGGVGAVIQLSPDTNLIQIKEIYQGSPSDKIGMRPGDRFLSIAGESMRGKNVSDVSGKLRGKAGEKVRVVVERPGVEKPVTFDVTREEIKVDAVNYYGMLDAETGYISLTGFETDCAASVKKAFLELRDKRGAKRMVLDLRYNPGGLLDESLQIVNMFVQKGSTMLSTHGRRKIMDKTYKAENEPVDTQMPLVVLINHSSASASEIVSGALQDLDRAVIMGNRSFGKGLVQATREVAHDGLVKVTTSKYYTPSGRCIQAIDYSQKGNTGEVVYIPDSLITEYHTMGGRSVFDGGGISPDVMLENKKYKPVTISVAAGDYPFRYALSLAVAGKKLETDANGFMTAAAFEDFVSFMKKQDKVTYKTYTQDAYDKMVAAAKKENLDASVAEELKKLGDAFRPDLERDMRAASEEICRIVEGEVVRMADYKRAAIRHSLKTDDQVAEAVKLLADTEKYNGLLSGTVPSHAGDKRAAKKIQKDTNDK